MATTPRREHRFKRLNAKAFVADVAAGVENDRRETVVKLAQAHGMSTKMVHYTLYEALNICNKSARQLPKQMDKEMKKEPVRKCEDFVMIIAAVP